MIKDTALLSKERMF